MICFPFANMALVAEVTGQQILDVLEHGAMYYPGEYGSFIQVSGIEYTIDEGIPSSVKLDATGTFLGVDGEYRVKNVLINGEPLIPPKHTRLLLTTTISKMAVRASYSPASAI